MIHSVYDYIPANVLWEFYEKVGETPASLTHQFLTGYEFLAYMEYVRANAAIRQPVYKLNKAVTKDFVRFCDLMYDFEDEKTRQCVRYYADKSSFDAGSSVGRYISFSECAPVLFPYDAAYGSIVTVICIGGGGGGAADSYNAGHPGAGGNGGHFSVARYHNYFKATGRANVFAIHGGKGGVGSASVKDNINRGGDGNRTYLSGSTSPNVGVSVTLSDGSSSSFRNYFLSSVEAKGGAGGGSGTVENCRLYNENVNGGYVAPETVLKQTTHYERYGSGDTLYLAAAGNFASSNNFISAHLVDLWDESNIFEANWCKGDLLLTYGHVKNEVTPMWIRLGTMEYRLALPGQGGFDCNDATRAFAGGVRSVTSVSDNSIRPDTSIRFGAGGYGENNAETNAGSAGDEGVASSQTDIISTIGRGGGGGAFSSSHKYSTGGDGADGGVIMFAIPNLLDFAIYKGYATYKVYDL